MSFFGPSGIRLLAASPTAVPHTGTTAETVLATVLIPGGAMGPIGRLRVISLWSYTNSANSKTMRIRLGGIAGLQVAAQVSTTTATVQTWQLIRNVNAENVQKMFNASSPVPFQTAATAALVTGAVNTAVDQNLVFTATLANTGETITLEDYMVELIR